MLKEKKMTAYLFASRIEERLIHMEEHEIWVRKPLSESSRVSMGKMRKMEAQK